MATPPSNESQLMFRLMVDRQWHFYDEIRREIARTVPPGRALRKYDTDLRGYARKAGKSNPNYQGHKTEDEKIRIGKNALAIATISSWRRCGAILAQGEGKGRQIKVRGGWTSNQFPGYEQELEPDPAEQPTGAEGYTDPPPVDSEPSEQPPPTPEAALSFGPALSDDSEMLRRRAEEWAAKRVSGNGETLTVQQVGDDDWQVADPMPVFHSVSPEGASSGPLDGFQTCELCGLVMVDEAKHNKWHESQTQPDTPSEMALLDESQLRMVVRSEMATILDQFQDGMQTHIEGLFAQLEVHLKALMRSPDRWIKLDE